MNVGCVYQTPSRELDMAQKFNPAPYDKHAADPKEAIEADKETHSRLEKRLEETFPASDPVSITQPVNADRILTPQSSHARLKP